MRKTTFVWLFILIAGPLLAQEDVLKDLLAQLKQPQSDTTRALLQCEVAWELQGEDPEQARRYLQDALCLSQTIGFLKGEATAFNYYGVLENRQGRIPDAIRYFKRALVLREQLDDQKGMASVHNNLGNIYVEQGENLEALKSYQASLKIMEELGDTVRIARANYSIALAHIGMSNFPEALNHIYEYLAYAESQGEKEDMANGYNLIGTIKAEIELSEEAIAFYEKARAIRETLDDPIALANTYQNLGVSQDNLGERYQDANQPDTALIHHQKALEWLNKSLALHQEQGNQTGVGMILLNLGVVEKNIGSVFKDKGDKARSKIAWEKALNLFNQSRAIREELGEEAGLIEIYNGIGDVHRRQGQYDLALQYTRQYMTIAERTGNLKFVRTGWKDLSRIYSLQANWEEAYKARKKYDELRWEEFDQKRIQDYERREVVYGDAKKQAKLEKQEQEIALQDARLAEARTRQRALLGGGAGLVLLALLLYNRNRIKTQANKNLAEKNTIINAERQKSDALLLNILPASTAAELKQYGRAQARHYESVTVLFTDFVGFTQLAATLGAEELVNELDACFRAFDAIIGRYGLEKIKTIGDAYLCAGGLPEEKSDHAEAVIRAALEMQTWIGARYDAKQAVGQPAFQMRAGIHTGPVVAGVVGDRKFAYDIWGDTVNTAQRVESAGAPGRINISADTYAIIKDIFPCEARGEIAAKGKGNLAMYFIGE
jgi:adenylate cyclase